MGTVVVKSVIIAILYILEIKEPLGGRHLKTFEFLGLRFATMETTMYYDSSASGVLTGV